MSHRYIQMVLAFLFMLLPSCNTSDSNNDDRTVGNAVVYEGCWVVDNDIPIEYRFRVESEYHMTHYGIVSEKMYIDILNNSLRDDLQVCDFKLEIGSQTDSCSIIELAFLDGYDRIVKEGKLEVESGTISFKDSDVQIAIRNTETEDNLILEISKAGFIRLMSEGIDPIVLSQYDDLIDITMRFVLKRL